ncbi:hypothetical protein K474DRAFT_1710731 [Panus rudis PR-1116 ss-1]|nr:hypothetical protein K474DRAFT_1710731 [Panus rudis PR-1116 ss-1]
MRIKVQGKISATLFKAWFCPKAESTISELKENICSEVQALRDADIDPSEVILVLDDFELLDSSPIDVLRDGDLVVVKHVPHVSNKRKALHDDGQVTSKRRKVSSGNVKQEESRASTATRSHSQAVRSSVGKQIAHAKKAKAGAGSSSEESSDSSSSSSSSSSDSDSDSDDSSNSEDSSEDSDDTSDSDSDSDESSSDSSSSSSSSAPQEVSSRRAAPSKGKPKPTETRVKRYGSLSHILSIMQSAHPLASQPTGPFVPPGHGKSSTRSRNARRRRKKQYERLAQDTEPANPNDVPLGTRKAASQPEEQEPEEPEDQEPATSSATPAPDPSSSVTQGGGSREIMMASLSNKNKRRGFKNALSKPVPAKIVFDSEDQPSGSGDTSGQTNIVALQDKDVLPFAQASDKELVKTSSTSRPRLVPPSEKQDRGELPPNMFVTSVDVEEGMRSQKRKKKKAQARPTQVTREVENLDYGEAEEVVDMITTQRSPETPLSQKQNVNSGGANESDWTKVESRWNDLPRITQPSEVVAGLVLAWKELGINPATFSPEMLLNVAKVVSLENEKAVLEPLLYPSGSQLTFGGIDTDEDVPMEYEKVEVELKMIFDGDYRIVERT